VLSDPNAALVQACRRSHCALAKTAQALTGESPLLPQFGSNEVNTIINVDLADIPMIGELFVRQLKDNFTAISLKERVVVLGCQN
jgi:hypothetical protein